MSCLLLLRGGRVSFSKNHLASEVLSPRLAVHIPYELTEAVHLLKANSEDIWKAHLIVIGIAHEISPASTSQQEKSKDFVCGETMK